MIDHVTFGVEDFARSVAFYDRAFASLGVRRLFDDPSTTVRATATAIRGPVS